MTGTENISVGKVRSASSSGILIEIVDLETFETYKSDLQTGSYLKVSCGNLEFVVAIVLSVKAQQQLGGTALEDVIQIELQGVGMIKEDGLFERGLPSLPLPGEPAYVLGQEAFQLIFDRQDRYTFPLGRLAVRPSITYRLDGDRFFGKHVAVVGSTGSGKSCAVARILQEAVGIRSGQNEHKVKKKNSHIVIFDIHSEYSAAFRLAEDQSFSVNNLDVGNLRLPYWLMNSEELEGLFIESNELTSHNQVSQFKNAVIQNKIRHNPSVAKMNYDTPVFFSLSEVIIYLDNMNREVVSQKDGEENLPKLRDGSIIQERSDTYFQRKCAFAERSTSRDSAARNGPFNGDFSRFLSRLETISSDRRLAFLLTEPENTTALDSREEFTKIVKSLIGYRDVSNVTIVDLSGVPFEVLSIVVSLIARLLFDFSFHYTKIRGTDGNQSDAPIMLVCEEAHNYVPASSDAGYNASRRAIERIAKEGRKYGLSLMVVSQRPAEVSDTIMSQCNNFVALRLTNDKDQGYIKSLLPDNSRGITDVLPTLADGECVFVGDAAIVPSVVKFDRPVPEPSSQSVKFLTEWQKEWADVAFADVVKRWRQE